jgi:hypothetical protein
MQVLRAGDELVVLRLDRLGRSTRDVLNLVHELDEEGASLRVLQPEVTTAGNMRAPASRPPKPKAFTKVAPKTSMTMKSGAASPRAPARPALPAI